jgi:hypothetical protein
METQRFDSARITGLCLAAYLTLSACGQTPPASIEVDFSKVAGPMEMDKMAVGQGGLSDEPMWDARVPEIRALGPRVVRLFVQEYFDLLPAPGRYHFESLDRSVDTILAAGAKPLMSLCFKPRLLFPKIDQDIVEPNDEAAWEGLITTLVRHYGQRGTGIQYWEIGNEPDIGESGGCPYRFNSVNYVKYYQRTAAAILSADPQARVGGPALADWRSPILPALLDFCSTNPAPLHFVSWHVYTSDPQFIRRSIDGVRQLLQKHPSLKPETIIDEWNMFLFKPNLDPRFQPCFVAETVWQMKDAGLDYSCYYHIRDWQVSQAQFAPFMSPKGDAFMTRSWNRMPQFHGLFDYQNNARPAYFAFKLLSRLRGDRLQVTSTSPLVHGFAAHDPALLMDNVVVWNFSALPQDLDLTLKGLPGKMRTRHIVLDAAAPSADENARLRPDPAVDMPQGDQTLHLHLDAYALHYWSFVE